MLPMARLIATLLSFGFLAALGEVDKVTAHLYTRLDASRPPAVSVSRTSRETRAVTVARATGPEAVARYGNRVPPYPETLNYVEKVRSATAEIAATPPASDDGVIYKSYAIVDGWWTVVYSNVPPASGHYGVMTPTP